MAKWKNPPKAKVYEALSAVLDERVELLAECMARVWSSTRDKAYTVTWNEGFTAVGSNDNASFFQGYIGYPVIAVLLKADKIPFDAELAKPLKGVEWNALNKKFKRDYMASVEHVLAGVDEGLKVGLEDMVEEIFNALIALQLDRRPSKRPPSS